MPIFKLPVIKKFGILSDVSHLHFQQKCLKKAWESCQSEIKHEEHRNPLEISEEFILQFNSTEGSMEQGHLVGLARKMLHRCKRRSGFSSLGCGEYVDLPVAWTELILLAQCKGKIQEEALDILLVSLDQAPVNSDQIGVLFFIAESVLYRICCDAVQKSYLYSNEVKLSKIGFLTFLRLFVFHLSDQLIPYKENKVRLYTFLQVLPSCEAVYQPYPNILSALLFMLKVAEIICDIVMPLERKSTSDTNLKQNQHPHSVHSTSPDCNQSISMEYGQNKFEMNQFLWLSLLTWQCVQNNNNYLNELFQLLYIYKEELYQENWLYSALGLFFFGEAAKLNVSCLKVLMSFMRDFILSSLSRHVKNENCKNNSSSWPWEVAYMYSMVLADICLNGSISEIQKIAFIGCQEHVCLPKQTKELREASLYDLLHFSPAQMLDACDDIFWVVRYGVVHSMIKICRELRGNVNREGLRNAVWKALHKWKRNEKDSRVLEAVKVAEAEINGPSNPFTTKSGKALSTTRSLASFQYVGWRLANALCQLFLPAVRYIPFPMKPVPRKSQIQHPQSKHHKVEKKVAHLSSRYETLQKEILQAEKISSSHPDFITCTDMDLQRIIKNQWEKELQILIKEEEELSNKELQEKANAGKFQRNHEEKRGETEKKDKIV
ncbi:transmembrane protein 232 [Rhinatrema bivittatum]|uniref:transmembrane protein 232 n=1 Tax=Rhinatrema bivittatum TaxID=194408 RepID=UPI00112A490A|nr:transmembrane protein 232 [Rhinatrema bivittatum]XP_029427734.1 transmembrane protein 232 [Rhinatrema bivittatum]